MLYGKITPAANIIQQNTPFSSTTITADYMSAIARPYAPGASVTNFEVVFGSVVNDDQGAPVSFQRLFNSSVSLTAAELANWGTNDEILLTEVGTKIGCTVSNFVTLNQQNF